jgi:hypothetical protein
MEMFDNWRVQRNAIKQHILDMYDGTTKENRKDLYDFLEFVIGNYDLDDAIYSQVKEDIDESEDGGNNQSLQDIEREEYEENVLKRRTLC